MLSIFEYVNMSLLNADEPGFKLWFCLIKYCPKKRQGLNLLLTYGSIC